MSIKAKPDLREKAQFKAYDEQFGKNCVPTPAMYARGWRATNISGDRDCRHDLDTISRYAISPTTGWEVFLELSRSYNGWWVCFGEIQGALSYSHNWRKGWATGANIADIRAMEDAAIFLEWAIGIEPAAQGEEG